MSRDRILEAWLDWVFVKPDAPPEEPSAHRSRFLLPAAVIDWDQPRRTVRRQTALAMHALEEEK